MGNTHSAWSRYIAAPEGQHAIRLAIGFLFLREELSAELADYRVKAGVGKRQCHSIRLLELDRFIGVNFFRATSSIGGLRSVAISLVVAGNRSRRRRVTMPVPAPVSSTREGA